MKPSDRLHQLIQSLSPAERRYFSKFSRRHKKEGANLYLDLFNAIYAQEIYDEEKIKAHFADTSFARNFSFPKSHLYDQILRALQQYHYERSLSSTFRSEIEKIELLYVRGFYDHAHRILKKSLERALRFELPLQVLDLIRWKRRITVRTAGEGLSDDLKLLSDLETHWMNALMSEREAVHWHDCIYARLQEYRLQTFKEFPEEVNEAYIALQSILTSPNIPFMGRILAFTGIAHFHHLNEQLTEVHATYLAASNEWKQQPWQIQPNQERYLQTTGALLNSKVLIKDYQGLFQEIQLLRTRTDLDPSSMAGVFRITTNLELFYYLNTDQAAKAVGISDRVRTGLETHHAYLSPNAHLGLCHNLAIACWMSKSYSQALQWVTSIQQFPETEVRKDIQAYAPLLEKILHFELGNIELLESWFRSYAYRKRKGEAKEGPGKKVGGKELGRGEKLGKAEENPESDLEGLLLILIRDLLSTADPSANRQSREVFLNGLEKWMQQPGVPKLGLVELNKWATE